MDFEDFVQPEVGIAAAVVAVVASPAVRRTVRRGAVWGVAGVLMAGDAIASFARGVGQGAQVAHPSTDGSRQPSSGATSSGTTTTTVPTVNATSVTEETMTGAGEGV